MASRSSGDYSEQPDSAAIARSPSDRELAARGSDQQQQLSDADQTRADSDQTRADSDQTRADSDQTRADSDQTRADYDQTSAERDQAASDRDQAASDRDLAHGVDPRDHDVSRETRRRTTRERGQTAAARLESARRRDRTAQARDAAALARDQAAAERDRLMEQRDAQHTSEDTLAHISAQLSQRAAEQRRLAAEYRAHAAASRAQAARDRESAAKDREQGARDRQRALADCEALARALALSEIDPLTGARARAPGLTDLEHEIDRSRRSASPLVVVYVDVVGLKTLNDNQGHDAGDRLLKRVVALIKDHLRPYDLIIRLGGDEFLCAMSNTTDTEARKRFNAITHALAAGDPPGALRTGFTQLEPSDRASALIARADTQLNASRRDTNATPDTRP